MVKINIGPKVQQSEFQVFAPPKYRKVLKTSAYNFGFKRSDQQRIITNAFAKLLNSLPCPVQFLCDSKVIKPEEWTANIEDDDYREFVSEHVTRKNTVEKNFYVVFQAHDQMELNAYTEQISELLRRMRLRVEEVELPEPNVVPQLKPSYIKVEDWYYETLVVYDWPHSAKEGWLEELYNLEKNINVAMFVHPQDNEFAIKYLSRRIAQRGSTVIIKEEQNNYQNDLDDQLNSASLMREELYRNQGKFFFTSFYITVKARTHEQLQHDVRMVGAHLRSMVIKYKHATFRQDDGFRSTLPHGVDYLKSYYNMTTTPLKMFLPFLSANIIERNGILVGENTLNKSLIFLDYFAYSDASMIVLGKKGAGKSFTVKALVDKLARMGIEVTIFDVDGEFDYLAKHNSLLNVVSYGRGVEAKEQYKAYLKKYWMEVESDYINRRVKPRFLVMDEFWHLTQHDDEFSEIVQKISKLGRKRWVATCVITQEIKDLLENPNTRSILANSTFKILLNMEYNQKEAIQDTFSITEPEFEKLLESEEGEGILFINNNHVPFKTIVSDRMYPIITTKPQDIINFEGVV